MQFVVEPVEGVQNMRATVSAGIRFHFLFFASAVTVEVRTLYPF